jgi:hypothetical protein
VNKHSVPEKIWARWSGKAKALFNQLYDHMESQWAFTHPKAEKIPEDHWRTLQYNAAFSAACICDDINLSFERGEDLE